MLSRLIQKTFGLPYFPGQWAIASAMRRLLPGGIGLFKDHHSIRYFVHASSHIGHALARRVDLESDIDSLLPIGPIGLVLDVGCNAGTFGLPLARRARHVVCIDADSDQIKLLKRTLVLNRITNVTAIHAAVTSEPASEVIFHVADRLKDLSARDVSMLDGRDSYTTRTVPALALETVVAEYGPVDLLKIDIEGRSGDAIRSLGRKLHEVKAILAEPSDDMPTKIPGFSLTQPLVTRVDLPDHLRLTWLAIRINHETS